MAEKVVELCEDGRVECPSCHSKCGVGGGEYIGFEGYNKDEYNCYVCSERFKIKAMTPQPPSESETELLPCPFCGSKSKMGSSFAGNWEAYCVNVDCRARGGPFSQQTSAIEAWNRRSK